MAGAEGPGFRGFFQELSNGGFFEGGGKLAQGSLAGRRAGQRGNQSEDEVELKPLPVGVGLRSVSADFS